MTQKTVEETQLEQFKELLDKEEVLKEISENFERIEVDLHIAAVVFYERRPYVVSNTHERLDPEFKQWLINKAKDLLKKIWIHHSKAIKELREVALKYDVTVSTCGVSISSWCLSVVW